VMWRCCNPQNHADRGANHGPRRKGPAHRQVENVKYLPLPRKYEL